jgi:hypothetical protein
MCSLLFFEPSFFNIIFLILILLFFFFYKNFKFKTFILFFIFMSFFFNIINLLFYSRLIMSFFILTFVYFSIILRLNTENSLLLFIKKKSIFLSIIFFKFSNYLKLNYYSIIYFNWLMRLSLSKFKTYLILINFGSFIYILFCIFINITNKEFLNIYIYIFFIVFALFFILRIFHNFVFFFLKFEFNPSNILLYAPLPDSTDFSKIYATIINNTPPSNPTPPLLPVDPIKLDLHNKFIRTTTIALIAIGLGGLGLSGYSIYLSHGKTQEELLLAERKLKAKEETNSLKKQKIEELRKHNEELRKHNALLESLGQDLKKANENLANLQEEKPKTLDYWKNSVKKD